jgi:hypothetical protein
MSILYGEPSRTPVLGENGSGFMGTKPEMAEAAEFEKGFAAPFTFRSWAAGVDCVRQLSASLTPPAYEAL